MQPVHWYSVIPPSIYKQESQLSNIYTNTWWQYFISLTVCKVISANINMVYKVYTTGINTNCYDLCNKR